jgi:hypothetical protein
VQKGGALRSAARWDCGVSVEQLEREHWLAMAKSEIQYSLASALQASGLTEQAAEMFSRLHSTCGRAEYTTVLITIVKTSVVWTLI